MPCIERVTTAPWSVDVIPRVKYELITRISCIKFPQNLFIKGYEWQAFGRHFISCFTLCVKMPSRLSVIDFRTNNFHYFLPADVLFGICVGILFWIRTKVISASEAEGYCNLTRSAMQNVNWGENVQWYVPTCGKEINLQQRFSISPVPTTL